VPLIDPDYVGHMLRRAQLNYVESNEYEPIPAPAGITLTTAENDSWPVHRTTLNPPFACPRRNEIADLLLEPITTGLVRGTTFAPGSTVLIRNHHPQEVL
jgi:hypothetical protein